MSNPYKYYTTADSTLYLWIIPNGSSKNDVTASIYQYNASALANSLTGVTGITGSIEICSTLIQNAQNDYISTTVNATSGLTGGYTLNTNSGISLLSSNASSGSTGATGAVPNTYSSSSSVIYETQGYGTISIDNVNTYTASATGNEIQAARRSCANQIIYEETQYISTQTAATYTQTNTYCTLPINTPPQNQPYGGPPNTCSGLSLYQGPTTNVTASSIDITAGAVASGFSIDAFGNIYFTLNTNNSSTANNALCYSATNELLWSVNLPSTITTPYLETIPIESMFAIGNNNLIYNIGTDGVSSLYLYVLNSITGETVGQFDLGGLTSTNPALNYSPAVVETADTTTVYVANWFGDIYSINVTPSTTLQGTYNLSTNWTYSTADTTFQISLGAPIVDSLGNIVFTSQTAIYSLNSYGENIYTTQVSNILSSLSTCQTNQTSYFVTEDGLQKLTTDGTTILLYKLSLPENCFPMQSATPTINPNVDGNVYIYFLYGYSDYSNPFIPVIFATIYCVDQNGTQIWNTNFNNYVSNNLTIGSDGTVYYCVGNIIYACNGSSGTQIINYTNTNQASSLSAIGKNGNLYFADITGSVIILK